jgi:cytochrome c
MKYILSLCFLIAAHFLANSPAKPDDSRFTKIVLDDDLNEPMELAIADDGMVYYIERIGHINSFDPVSNKKKRITTLNVRSTAEDGLLGLALDPQFLTNHWLYLYYGDPVAKDNEYANVLARFELTETGLSNRVELLRVPLIHEGVNHSGGSLAFDKKGNLYLSTGDNTSPFESNGYSPSDDREGRLRFDALRSSGNTNDLRGKIIRIHPEEDGTYTIPEGNLFPKGTVGTRPEVYVMGCRNPFRIAVDNRTGFVYWGEVGPDAGKDSLLRGSKGHDEINQARKAGNFGWPLFVGNNKPYYKYDFDKKQSGEAFDAQKPINFSRNNTGLKELPPAQKAFIWYPYDASPEFPELGTGGRNAMGGPVYYSDDYEAFSGKFPSYFDKKLFIYDWMRGSVFTVAMKENGDFDKLERFLPNMEFNHPMDMAFNRKGEMYMLEYGTYWRAKNTDAKLVRIEYNEGNRAPVAKISADKTVGATPLTVNFSAKGSFDFDKNDTLKYEWFFTQQNKVQAYGMSPAFTFTKKGIYPCKVRVTDAFGKTTENTLTVRVGNAPPSVKLDWQGNQSFHFGETEVAYAVKINDKEDKKIDPKRTQIAFHYLPEGEDMAGMAATGEVIFKGKTLMEQSDCKACHGLNNKSVGPSYMDIAKRYDKTHTAELVGKIINGGGGVWTKDHVMSAHPQLLKEDVEEMVRYILSLNQPSPQIAPQGKVKMTHPQGNYFMTARYTDKGGLVGQDIVRLRPARLMAAEADVSNGVAKKNLETGDLMSYSENKAWIGFKNIDLSGLKTVKVHLISPKLVGNLEFRIGSPTGQIIAKIPVEGKGKEEKTATLTPTEGKHAIFMVYQEQSGGIDIWKRVELKWFEFGK